MSAGSRRARIAWEYLAGAAVAFVWLLLALDGARRLSATIDEVPHLGSGYAIAEYGDLRFNPEHPPLAKTLFALPMALFGGGTPPDPGEVASWRAGDQWSWGYRVLYHTGADPSRMLLLGRLVPIGIGLLGGVLAWAWAAEIGGRRAGFFAFSLLLFYPEYLGHARYATFDVPMLAGCAAVSLAAWRWWKRPTTARLLLFGAAAGIGSLVKLPVAVFAVLQFAVLAAIWLLNRVRPKRYGSTPAAPRPDGVALAAALGALAVFGFAAAWAGSGFQFRSDRREPLLERPAAYAQPPAEVPRGALLRATDRLRAARLLPETALAPINTAGMVGERRSFLLGQSSDQGYPQYYFVTVLLKTPVIYLLGGLHGLLLVWKRMLDARTWRRERAFVLVAPFLLLFAIVAASGLNIGHRHVLFIYFPWCVILGMILGKFTNAGGLRRGFAVLILSIAATSALVSHPFQATYFNVLVNHSPKNARAILSDSNVDWGESLGEAARELARQGHREANLLYFGMASPEAAGLERFTFFMKGFPLFPPSVYARKAGPMRADAPTLVSLALLPEFEAAYGTYARGAKPVVVNSILIFPPMRSVAPPGASGAPPRLPSRRGTGP
ncbi:MAG: glycosyltransferase family 39 protein [Candidatus Sumerlaeia bacterium]|nr:glycosyltransferase family 39 protein [Candidatus Sumerlaeia bacterium]